MYHLVSCPAPPYNFFLMYEGTRIGMNKIYLLFPLLLLLLSATATTTATATTAVCGGSGSLRALGRCRRRSCRRTTTRSTVALSPTFISTLGVRVHVHGRGRRLFLVLVILINSSGSSISWWFRRSRDGGFGDCLCQRRPGLVRSFVQKLRVLGRVHDFPAAVDDPFELVQHPQGATHRHHLGELLHVQRPAFIRVEDFKLFLDVILGDVLQVDVFKRGDDLVELQRSALVGVVFDKGGLVTSRELLAPYVGSRFVNSSGWERS